MNAEESPTRADNRGRIAFVLLGLGGLLALTGLVFSIVAASTVPSYSTSNIAESLSSTRTYQIFSTMAVPFIEAGLVSVVAGFALLVASRLHAEPPARPAGAALLEVPPPPPGDPNPRLVARRSLRR